MAAPKWHLFMAGLWHNMDMLLFNGFPIITGQCKAVSGIQKNGLNQDTFDNKTGMAVISGLLNFGGGCRYVNL